MAGHSQFKNIMHRKGAQDAKRAKLFTKLGRELTVAAKEGGDIPDSNPRLRSAIAAARAQNMPKDNIDRAIKRGLGADGADNYEAVRYEGYGPSGIAVIVEALTDNRNRTASEVRSAFTKFGGNLGETGSVAFMFDQVGHLKYPSSIGGADAIFEAVLEAGADDVVSDASGHDIYCGREVLAQVREALVAIFGEPESCSLIWQPQTITPLQDVDKAKSVLKLVDILEDNDDVQHVYANFDISEEVLSEIT